jgi:hypothetical protein
MRRPTNGGDDGRFASLLCGETAGANAGTRRVRNGSQRPGDHATKVFYRASPQQFLNFFPLPQGQGSLRPASR